MITAKIILLIAQFGLIGFLLFYGLPQLIKSRREIKKRVVEVKTEMEETKKLANLCVLIFEGRATEADVAAFEESRKKWEEKHWKIISQGRA